MLRVYVDSTFDVVWLGSTEKLIAGLETDKSKHYASEMLAVNIDMTIQDAYLGNHGLGLLSQFRYY